jgi:hypothetical protein
VAGPFLHRALRTVQEYHEKVEYIHRNPVKAGLVNRPEDWRWSSVQDYTGSVKGPPAPSADNALFSTRPSATSVLSIDRVLLPADERRRI